jgi:hypothetical protein
MLSKESQLRNNGKKKVKRVSVSSLKRTAWTLFSRYIRTRDCLRTTGSTDRGVCCTCGVEYDFKELQAGHFEQGRHNATLFDKRNVHAQCSGCNLFKHGNLRRYEKFMVATYGQGVVDELDTLDTFQRQLSVLELSQLIIDIKYDIDNLESNYRNGMELLQR